MADVTVDRQIWEIMVKGIEKSKAEINGLATTWSNAISGMEKKGVYGSAGITSAINKLEKQMISNN